MSLLPLSSSVAAVSIAVCAFIGAPRGQLTIADDELPALTMQNAASLVGKPAMLEIKVVEVKFAQRRGLHFLSSTTNFRSQDNQVIAIHDRDLHRFGIKDVSGLQTRYQNRTVRARGQVTVDEGQTLLVVDAPMAIEILDGDKPPPTAVRKLTIVDEAGHSTELLLPLPAELSRKTVSVEHEGAMEEYRGVLLADVLAECQVPLGAEVRGSAAVRYLLVTAADNYAALLSVPEVDPFFTDEQVLLAETLNGQPVPRGLLQLVVPADKRRRRWVSHVVRIQVRNPLKTEAQR